MFRYMRQVSKTIFMEWLQNKVKRGETPLILVVGEQRKGKTALALRLAWEISQFRKVPFEINEDMFFKIEDFAYATQDKQNKTFVIDEAGISLDSYEHMSMEQRVYKHIIQTQAYKQNIVFLVLPFASEIGKQHTKHVHVILHVFDRGCYAMYRTIRWHNDLSQRPPRQELMERIVGIPLPPPEIWDEYKNKHQLKYKEEIMDLQIDMIESKKKRKALLNAVPKKRPALDAPIPT